MKILVSGGLGYCGSVLVPKLLKAGHQVTVLDIGWFGNHLKEDLNLEVVIQDIRKLKVLADFDVVIHLAAVANDPCGELDSKLTWETNALGTMKLADLSVRGGVKQFIYASSGSVYGVKKEEKVTEELSLEPLSDYNKTKMVAERCLLSYKDRMIVQIVRPGTVCGFSPRMRLDTVVNSFTTQALTTGKIHIHGGGQIRPNIHIEDLTDFYLFLVNNPGNMGIYNAGFENRSLLEIADRVNNEVPCKTIIGVSNDQRSYRMDSSKILDMGFKPTKGITDAIRELVVKYQAGELNDDPRWYNLKSMPKC